MEEEDMEMDGGGGWTMDNGGTGHLAWVVGAKDEVKQAQRATN